MRFSLFLLILCISISAFAGREGGNGGDPIRVYAQAFPDAPRLNEAISIAKEKIATSLYAREFKEGMILEIESFVSKGHIQYIPKEMVLLPDFSNYPYMVSIGAITRLEKGSIVYFTKQSIDYSARDLARVILQEIPHHIFINGLETDEAFINNLGILLIEGRYEESADKRLERVYYKNEFLIAKDLISYIIAHGNCSKAPSHSTCRCDNATQSNDVFIRKSFNGYLGEKSFDFSFPKRFVKKSTQKALRRISYQGTDRYGKKYQGERCISIVELGEYMKSLIHGSHKE